MSSRPFSLLAASKPSRDRRMPGARILVLAVCGCGFVLPLKAQPSYTIAYSGFAPLNADIFIADADGRNPKPFLANAAED